MKHNFYGIDFGTSNSAVAHLNNYGDPEVIPLDSASKNPNMMRTLIYISQNREFAFGEKAIELYSKDVIHAKPATKQIIVRKILSETFGDEKLKDKDSFTSVASGLAIYGKDVF